jgi:tRNA pseudouridine55 synthase
MINVVKPPQMTSHDVVSWMRRQLKMKKIGHSGTLDPMATGVVNVMIGQATRLIPYLQNPRKTYRATMRMGLTSDTLDRWGIITEAGVFKMPSSQEILDVFKLFTGEIIQIPPMYSAVKVGGRKLYELARQGEVIERKNRTIYIEKIELVEIVESSIMFDVVCSRGTYIRTLIDDIGIALGTRAIMTDLIRIENEGIDIAQALTLEEIRLRLNYDDDSMILSPLEMMQEVEERIVLDEDSLNDLKNGRHFKLDVKNELALLIYREKLVGLAGIQDGNAIVLRRFISEV